MHSVSKHMRLSEPTTKTWMKIDPYYQRQRHPMTLVSGNIRFMRIFLGIPGERASNDSGIIENVDFHGFRALRIRHLRKWGLHYYIVLFSPLSPFHWTENTWPWWPWMTLNGRFTLNFLYYEPPFQQLGYILRVRLHTWPAKMCGSGPWSAEYLESAKKLRIFRSRYIVGTLANKASVSIYYYLVP